MAIASVRRDLTKLAGLARGLRREPCTWYLVQYAPTSRGGFVDVRWWSSSDLDLFGLLALMVVWRDHGRRDGCKFVLYAYAPERIEVGEVRLSL